MQIWPTPVLEKFFVNCVQLQKMILWRKVADNIIFDPWIVPTSYSLIRGVKLTAQKIPVLRRNTNGDLKMMNKIPIPCLRTNLLYSSQRTCKANTAPQLIQREHRDISSYLVLRPSVLVVLYLYSIGQSSCFCQCRCLWMKALLYRIRSIRSVIWCTGLSCICLMMKNSSEKKEWIRRQYFGFIWLVPPASDQKVWIRFPPPKLNLTVTPIAGLTNIIFINE